MFQTSKHGCDGGGVLTPLREIIEFLKRCIFGNEVALLGKPARQRAVAPVGDCQPPLGENFTPVGEF